MDAPRAYSGTGLDPAVVPALVAGCTNGTAQLPDGTLVTVASENLPLDPLGTAAVGTRVRLTYREPDGNEYPATLLSAHVTDGDRVVVLRQVTVAPGVEPDPNLFVALVRTAYDVQHDALG